MLQLSEFAWTLRTSVWVVFNNFLLIDALDKSKISSDQNRLFFAVSLFPFHFSRTLPLSKFRAVNKWIKIPEQVWFCRNQSELQHSSLYNDLESEISSNIRDYIVHGRKQCFFLEGRWQFFRRGFTALVWAWEPFGKNIFYCSRGGGRERLRPCSRFIHNLINTLF